jgi:hypothetical protein
VNVLRPIKGGLEMKRARNTRIAVVFTGILIAGLAIANAASQKSEQDNEIEFEAIDIQLDDKTPGTATLTYTHVAKQTAHELDLNEVFNLGILFDEENPKLTAAIIGGDQRTQIVRFGGNYVGALCWYTLNHELEYEITGQFFPKDCTFEIQISTKVIESKVTANACPMLPPSISHLYDPAPQGPFKIAGNLEPVNFQIADGVTAVITLSDVIVPESTGCQW